jgi:RimJ/RimL family protein N-acetyltransferase
MKKLETERLFLRQYEEKDKEYFLNLFTDEKVMKFVGDGVLTKEQAEAFWLKLFEKLYPENYNIWAIFTTEDLSYVGHAGIYESPTVKGCWEFVYFLNQNAWGKGYATEIARKIIRFGFEELELTEIFTTIDDENSASIKVAEKAGMSFLRYEFDKEGRFSVYSIKGQNRLR